LSDKNRLQIVWHPFQDTPNPFFTRKPTVTELNFEIKSIKLYNFLMGKRTFLLLFMWFYRFTLCWSDQNFLKNKT